MKYSRFLYLQISDPTAFKHWLAESWHHFTSAKHIHSKDLIAPTHLNIAFSAEGLRKLGLKDENFANFSREFRDGMVNPHRSRLLGDSGDSCPKHWNWGNDQNGTNVIHLCLMISGRDVNDENDLDKDKKVCLDYYAQLESEFSSI